MTLNYLILKSFISLLIRLGIENFTKMAPYTEFTIECVESEIKKKKKTVHNVENIETQLKICLKVKEKNNN